MSRNYANMSVDEILRTVRTQTVSEKNTMQELSHLREDISDLLSESRLF